MRDFLKNEKKQSVGIDQVKVYFLCVFIISTNSLKECSRLQFNMNVGVGELKTNDIFVCQRGRGRRRDTRNSREWVQGGSNLGPNPKITLVF